MVGTLFPLTLKITEEPEQTACETGEVATVAGACTVSVAVLEIKAGGQTPFTTQRY